MSQRIVRGVGAVTLAGFVMAAFTPLPNSALRALAAPADLGPADAIVVLGAGVDSSGTLSHSSLRRLVEGVRLARAGLAPVVLLCGPREGQASEAAARGRMAETLGVSGAQTRLLTNALTTGEEARSARGVLGPSVRTVLLVSGEHHLPRAAALFRRAGFEVRAAPVDELGRNNRRPEERLRISRAVAQELAGRLYYLLSGQL